MVKYLELMGETNDIDEIILYMTKYIEKKIKKECLI